MKPLSGQQIDLLEKVIEKRAPALQPLIARLRMQPYPAVVLSDSEVQSLSQVVIDEFCEEGLNADDEPNEYGVRLDCLAGSLLLREGEVAEVPFSSVGRK
ncbi:MAG: hypothetical protein RMM08_05040 [Armatimonadota bacterium]|nr:hypothetical protein [bacterium]MDW8320705.1 hypothetical protein [Armatimonadota bacterium]